MRTRAGTYFLLGWLFYATGLQAAPLAVIYDSDLGNEVDDLMALSMLHALQSRGACRLLAVTVSKDNALAARCADLVNTFYGRGHIPVGIVRNGPTPADGDYLRTLVEAQDNGQPRYPHDLGVVYRVPTAVSVLRRALADQPMKSVTIIQTGFSTNLARLLDTPPDEISLMTGQELVKAKVRLLSVTGGAFTKELLAESRKDFHIIKDVPSARKVFSSWPTPVAISGWDVGFGVQVPAQSIRRDYRWTRHHPVVEACTLSRGLELDQPAFALTSVLFAVRPQRAYFDLSEQGRLKVERDGTTRFVPDEEGRHRYLRLNRSQVRRVQEIVAALVSQPTP